MFAQYEELFQSEVADPNYTPQPLTREELQERLPITLKTPQLHAQPIIGIDQSSDRDYILTYDEKILKVWDTKQQVELYNVPAWGGSSIAYAYFTNTPRQIVVCQKNGVITYDDFDFSKHSKINRYYNLTDAYPSRYLAESDTLYQARFTSQLLVRNNQGKQEFYRDTPTLSFGSVIFKLNSEEYPFVDAYSSSPREWQPFTISEDGSIAAYSFGTQEPLLVFDLINKKRLHSIPVERNAIGILPDGRILALPYKNGKSQIEFLNPVTLAATEGPEIQLPHFRTQYSVSIPERQDDPILINLKDGFILYDLITKQLSDTIRNQRETTAAKRIYINGKPRIFVAQNYRNQEKTGAITLSEFDIEKGVFRKSWTAQTFLPVQLSTRHNRFEFMLGNGIESRHIQLTESGVISTPIRFESSQEITPQQSFYNTYTDQWEILNLSGAGLAIPDSEKGYDKFTLKNFDPAARISILNQWIASQSVATAMSADNRIIALHHGTAITVYDRSQNDKYIYRFYGLTNLTNFDHLKGIGCIAISPDGSRVAFSSQTKNAEGKIVGSLLCHDIVQGKPLWNTEATESLPQQLAFSADGSRLYTSKSILYADTGEMEKKFKVGGLRAYNQARTLFANVSNNSIQVYTLPDQNLLAEIPFTPSVKDIHFIGSDRFLIITEQNSEKLYLIDTKEQQVAAELYLYESPQKWLVRNPETGLFVSDEELLTELYFTQGEKITPLQSYFDQFYRPRLLGSLFQGLTLKPAINLAELAAAPKLKLSIDGPSQRGLTVEDEFETIEVPEETVTLKLEATSVDSAIKDLRVYQNGKLVFGGDTRGLFVEDDDTLPEAKTEVFQKVAHPTFPLIAGKNRFRAIAINEQGTESVADEMVIYSKSAPEAVVGGIQLYLFVIGINRYTNPDYSLNYARKDAETVTATLLEKNKDIYTKTHVHTLYDDEATKENIRGLLDLIRTEASPRDAFIFYYAGHGVMSSEEDPEFYLIPYEATQLYGNDTRLKQQAISGRTLLEYSRDIAAQKQLFILDACQSAGALKTVAVRGAAEEKAIAQLARSTGTHWLTATGSEQFATEFEALGHGAFTYTLLEALTGKADTGDGIVSVNELKAYIEAQVPEVTERYKGEAQYPASYGYGQDFPISISN